MRFEPHHHHSEPTDPDNQKSPGSPSKSDAESKDLESGIKSPSQDSPPSASRRLSKRGRFEVPDPKDNVIVSPGDDSDSEKDEKDLKRPGLADTRQSTLVNNEKWITVSNRNSIASQGARSISGNVKVIVKPDGRMSRVLSRRSSYVSAHKSDRARDKDEEDDDDDDKRSTRSRRLSRHHPESMVAGSSRRSISEDGFHSAVESVSRRTSRRSSVHEPNRLSGDAATIRNRAGYESDGKDKNDDPLSKYYWDPQRGWLERK